MTRSGPSQSRGGLVPAVRRACARVAPADGATLSEMLVVILILGIVLAGMTALFVSASNSQVDQSNRSEAQRNARLALDALRREIRCASGIPLDVSGVPLVTPSSLTITLPGYCQKPLAASPASFTWCAVGAGAPYALWRYAGSLCSGTGRIRAKSLFSSSVFTYSRSVTGPVQAVPVVGSPVVNGFFNPGTYAYDVTAVTSTGTEISGSVKSVTFLTDSRGQITVSWTAYAGAVKYNVYGRDNGSTTPEGLRLLATPSAGTTSYVDTGAAFLSGASPPLATVGISLVLDETVADTKQRFTLGDYIVLRNSGRR